MLECAACHNAITTAAARVTVDGQDEYDGENPDGYCYRFGCFMEAPGCTSRGVPSKQCTWFPGHYWHVQVCGGCGQHLGWWFFHEDSGFYGLILERLSEAE